MLSRVPKAGRLPMGKLNTTNRPSAFTEATFPFRGPPSVTIAPELAPGESGAELTGGLAARPALASTGGLGLAQPARMAAASKIGYPDRMESVSNPAAQAQPAKSHAEFGRLGGPACGRPLLAGARSCR